MSDTDPAPCACGHARTDHVYEYAACRPGFVCPDGCFVFRPKTTPASADEVPVEVESSESTPAVESFGVVAADAGVDLDTIRQFAEASDPDGQVVPSKYVLALIERVEAAEAASNHNEWAVLKNQELIRDLEAEVERLRERLATAEKRHANERDDSIEMEEAWERATERAVLAEQALAEKATQVKNLHQIIDDEQARNLKALQRAARAEAAIDRVTRKVEQFKASHRCPGNEINDTGCRDCDWVDDIEAALDGGGE